MGSKLDQVRPRNLEASIIPSGYKCILSLSWLILVWTVSSTLAAAASPAVWPDQGPYHMVGGDLGNGYTAKLPLPVIEALRQLIPDDPTHWSILQAEDFSGQGKRLLQITGRKSGGYVNLLLDSGSWVNLSATEGVPFLNKVLEPLRPTDLQDDKKVEKYFRHVIYLQKYGLFVILTPELRRQRFTEKRLIDLMNVPKQERQALLAKDPGVKQAQIDTWLEGSEKNREKLLALFHPLSFTKSRDRMMVRCNIMNPLGAVEQWTIHLNVDDTVKLETVDTVELCKEGTFSYPLVQ